MDVTIRPARLSGQIDAPVSKSCAQRLLICSALSSSPTVLHMNGTSDDIDTVAQAVKNFGADIAFENSDAYISPHIADKNGKIFDCKESGAALRFLLPIAAALLDSSVFYADGSLSERPISELVSVLSEHGIDFSDTHLPFGISGRLAPGKYEITGSVSSQYISGLLFALPLLNGNSDIYVSTPLVSSGYVEMTIQSLSCFGIDILKTDYGFFVKGNQEYKSPGEITVEGDWSGAAFFLAAAALSGNVTVNKLNSYSLQRDKDIIKLLHMFGANIKPGECEVTVSADKFNAVNADLSDMPDMLPVLSVLAAASGKRCTFTGVERLKYKESDRLNSCCEMINSLGGKALVESDAFIVGPSRIVGGTVNSFNDHRIAMAAAAASCICGRDVHIKGAECVKKSYPGFWRDFIKLGGILNVF